jgi:hypothetical protein
MKLTIGRLVAAGAGLVAFLAALLFAGPSAFAQVLPEIDTGTATTVSDVPPPVIHTEVHEASPFWVFALVVLIAVAATLLIRQVLLRIRPMLGRRLRSA